MKHYIKIILCSCMFILFSNINIFAYTNNYVTNQLRVKTNAEIYGENTPKLIISASSDHNENFYFEVYINNGIWSDKYSNDGTLVDGISYKKITSKRILFDVNTSLFNTQLNDIVIPLYTIADASGDIYVGISSKGSAVTEGEYKFATAGVNQIKIFNEPIQNMSSNGYINDIKLFDDFNSSINSGTKYEIKLKKGFKFLNLPKIYADGKYSNNVDIKFNDKEQKSIIIEVKNTTENGQGSILISDININTDDCEYGDINADFLSNIGGNTEINLGTFGNKSNTINKIEIDTNFKVKGDSIILSGKATKGKFVILNIDDNEISKVRVDDDDYFEFSFDKTIIDDGKNHNIVVGYYNVDSGDITYITEFECSFDIEEYNIVIYEIDKNGYIYNDKYIYTDDMPYIDKNGVTMIPLRTFSNSIGINNDNIIWNADINEVSIKTNYGNILFKIGDNIIYTPTNKYISESCPIIENNKTYVPLRTLLNAYNIDNKNIIWNGDNKTITIKYKK